MCPLLCPLKENFCHLLTRHDIVHVPLALNSLSFLCFECFECADNFVSVQQNSMDGLFKREKEMERKSSDVRSSMSKAASMAYRGGGTATDALLAMRPHTSVRPRNFNDFGEFIRSELEKSDNEETQVPPPSPRRAPPPPPADVTRQRNADSHSDSRDASDVSMKQQQHSPSSKYSPSLPPLKPITNTNSAGATEERGQGEYKHEPPSYPSTPAALHHSKSNSSHSPPTDTFAPPHSERSMERQASRADSCEEDGQLVICESGAD